jgi:hypothetical protein
MRLFYSRKKDMKASKTLLIIVCLFAVSQISIGQEKPQPVLIDEFGKANCEDLSARLDGFYIQLRDAPNSKGFIIIYGDKNDQLEKYYRERFLKQLFALRGNSPNLTVFIRGKDEENIRTQFWKVLEGSAKPFFEESNWNFELSRIKKPFIIHANSWIDEICPTVFGIDFYSQLLLANPNVRGHLVIYEKSLKRFLKTEKDLLNKLTQNYKVPSSQLKTFYVKKYNSDVEFWLVQKKQK